MEKTRNKTVEPEKFIKAWQSAQDIDGVIKATGMNVHSAQYRARIYRKKGIKLQAFAPRRGAPKLDIVKLSRLAAEAAVAAGRKPVKTSKKVANKKARKRPSKKTAKKSKK